MHILKKGKIIEEMRNIDLDRINGISRINDHKEVVVEVGIKDRHLDT